MRRILLGGCLLAAVTLLSGAAASAQDFGHLLDAVDRLEASLKAMVESESEARKNEIAELRGLMEQKTGTAVSPGDQAHLAQLVLEVKALRADVDRLSTSQTTPPLSESDLATIINDIEYLKSEMNLLQATAVENKRLLASIDEEGFYVPPEENPKLKLLTDRLTELNTAFEEVISQESRQAVSNPSVKHGRIVLTGFVHQHYYHQGGTDETSTFRSKRARLGVKGDINQYAQLKIVGEFAKTPKLVDGLVTISPHSQWSFCIGQYKPPFGTDFLTSSTAMPFVNSSVAKGLGTGRDIGFSVLHKNQLDEDSRLKVTLGLFNGSGINTSDANSNKNVVGRVELNLAGMFTIAPDFYVGKTNDTGSLKQDINDFAGSVTWKWKSETAQAEYIRSKVGDTKRGGWYVWGGHSFSTGSRFLPELQLLARFEQYDPDLDVTDNRVDRITVGANLFIDKKYTKIQLNYQINGEQGASVDNDEFLMNFQVAF